ncbi:MAG: serine hydrolase [Candidatus Krumholzibacteria bacterium]|nr:serine hydrolase [Candidatus Krumholzibacteria bacterium]
MEEQLQGLAGIRAQSDGFDVHGSRTYTPPRPATTAVIVATNRLTGAWTAIVVDVEEAEPYRVAGLRFAPARIPTDVPPEKPLSDAEIVKQLGAIVEKASGEDYFDYVRAHVTGPAGMKNTDCYELDLVNENLAVGYEKEQGPNGTRYRNKAAGF